MAVDKDFIKFQLDLDKFSKKVDIDFATLYKKVAFDLLTGVVMKTPVLTGRARNSWNIALDSINEDVAPDGQQPLDDPSAKVASINFNKPFGTIFISNNLPYIGELENGSSKQAPQGMLQVTINEIETALR